MKRLIFAVAMLWAGMASAQVTLTGDVRSAAGQGISITPDGLFVQSCNGGAGGIVGQDGCALPIGGGDIVGGVVQPQAAATGGMSVASKLVVNNTTSVAIKASPGTLYGITVWNNSATIAYLKIYNTAQGSTTCGSGTPVQRIIIPASTSGAVASVQISLGVAYSTAITSCVTTGYADNDTGAPTASAYVVEFYYK